MWPRSGRVASVTSRRGSRGRSSCVTTSAITPPTSASRKRSGVNPLPGGSSATTNTADTAACDTNSDPAPSSSAVAIARPTTAPICQKPVPINTTSASATPIPTATPATSSVALRTDCPRAGGERDHRRDRREHRRRVVPQLSRQKPRRTGRDRRLQDEDAVRLQPVEPLARRAPDRLGHRARDAIRDGRTRLNCTKLSPP